MKTYKRNPYPIKSLENHLSQFRPAGLSDEDDSDDESDFSFAEPRHPKKIEPVITTQDKFQELVEYGPFNEFEAMITQELNNEIDYRFSNNWTPLMYACFYAQPQMVDYLLERGADPNAHADSVTALALLSGNKSPLLSSNERTRGIAIKLLKHGAILNLGDKNGATPLMLAVQHERDDLAKFLIENHANIEMRDRMGWTAIFWAVHCNRIGMLDYLISVGARLTEVDRSNRTILDIAEAHGYIKIVNMLEPYFAYKHDRETSYVTSEPKYWLNYYIELINNKKPMYKEEMSHLVYGLNCEHLRAKLFKNQIDLITFLLWEEKDMIEFGIEMDFERQRIQQGLRAFHTRNWKLKCVSGLYAKLNENYKLIDCLDHLTTNLMQMSVLEASLVYAVRHFKKLRYKYQPPELQTLNNMTESVDKLNANIKKIRKEIEDLYQSVEEIRRNNPEFVHYEIEEENEDKIPQDTPPVTPSSLPSSVVGIIYFSLGILTYRLLLKYFPTLSK